MEKESISSFAENQQILLKLELDSELQESALLINQAAPSTLQRAGLALLNLTVAAQRTGLGGKTLVELELDSAVSGAGTVANSTGDFPEHGLRNGDIVSLQTQPAGSIKKKAKEELESKGQSAVIVRSTLR